MKMLYFILALAWIYTITVYFGWLWFLDIKVDHWMLLFLWQFFATVMVHVVFIIFKAGKKP